MDRPKEAIERIRSWWAGNSDTDNVLAYLDWLEGKHVVEWPAELTLERLEELARGLHGKVAGHQMDALNALAAIAPQKRKRVVNLWRKKEWPRERVEAWAVDACPNMASLWECVARNIELEE